MMDDLKYLLDDEPISATGLLRAARDYGWDPGTIQQTSVAARYLRERGCVVGDNPDWEPDDG